MIKYNNDKYEKVERIHLTKILNSRILAEIKLIIITINYSLKNVISMDWLLFLGAGIIVGAIVGVGATLYMVSDKGDDDDDDDRDDCEVVVNCVDSGDCEDC